MDCTKCKKYKGDCGHHYVDPDNHIKYDTPSSTCCTRSGDCEYYEEARTIRRWTCDELMDLNGKLLSDGRNNRAVAYAIKVIANMSDEDFEKEIYK